MERPLRVNVTLDPEHDAKLTRLAERTHLERGTLARSLLLRAIDDADPEPRDVVALLDGIPGAYERAMENLASARRGETIPLDSAVPKPARYCETHAKSRHDVAATRKPERAARHQAHHGPPAASPEHGRWCRCTC
jgi:hypothetical protein